MLQLEENGMFDFSFFMVDKSFEYSGIYKIPETLLVEYLCRKDPVIASDVQDMFAHCPKLQAIPKMNIDTRFCEDFGYMFSCDKSLRKVDLSWLNTSMATYMASMFYYCEALEYVDFTNIDTSKVTKMMCMFYGCKNLKIIDGVIDMSSCTNAEDMLKHCDSLEYVAFKNVPDTLDLSNIGISLDKISFR